MYPGGAAVTIAPSTRERVRAAVAAAPLDRVRVDHRPYTAWDRPPREGDLAACDEAASALFQVVSQRYLKTSIVITTNRGVAGWGEILGDTTVASAMLDRLLHRSVVLNLDGDSYRLRDHHARTDTLRRTTTGTRNPLP